MRSLNVPLGRVMPWYLATRVARPQQFSLFTQVPSRGVLRSWTSALRGSRKFGAHEKTWDRLPRPPLLAQALLPKGPPSSSSSAPPRRPRNCTLSATTSTLLLLEPSWASQVLYCSLPSTRMGSPFFL